MTNQVYTIGYSGAKPQQIKALIDDLGAILIDIRLSPRSRVPYWNQAALVALVGPGNYIHLRALGNVNYKGGPIQIADFESGADVIKKQVSPVVLMCACEKPDRCHRVIIGRQLASLGLGVTEVEVKKYGQEQVSSQIPLF